MVEHKIEAEAIYTTLQKASSVLLIAHSKPDGDTVGCTSAWLSHLSSQGKSVSAFCIDDVRPPFTSIPESHRIGRDQAVFHSQFDVIMLNDCADLDYAGVEHMLKSRDNSGTTVINIDHHATNPRYGAINLVIDNASSTAEIVSRLFSHWNLTITKSMAEALLHGIVFDTGVLTNPATNYTALGIASELIRAGADLHGIVRRMLYTKSIPQLRIWGLVLSRLQRNDRLGIVSSYITTADLENASLSVNDIEGIPNYLTLIPDINAVLFLRQLEDNTIKGSLRSIKDSVDVSRLAQELGGGGHKKAAGFKLSGKLVINGDSWTIR